MDLKFIPMTSKKLLIILTAVISLVLIFNLFNIQIIITWGINYTDRITIRTQKVKPERGEIYDRYGNLLVTNKVIYNLMVIPNELEKFDTIKFAQTIGISTSDLKNQIQQAKNYSSFLSSEIRTDLSDAASVSLNEKLWQYPGFYLEKNLVRDYKTTAAYSLLGYTNEVTQDEINQQNSPYSLRDHIGRSGIEKQYESQLKGHKGVRYFLVDKFNREISSYEKGEFDIPIEKAENLTLTIDKNLQQYGFDLMNDKRGAIVAIEPQSGEVLALISRPGYDSDSLQRSKDRKYFNSLYNDTLNRPFYNRALQAEYAPGSTFKVLNGLIGLHEKIVTTQTNFTCNYGYQYAPNAHMACRCPLGTRNNITQSILKSCNSFHAKLYTQLIDSERSPEIAVNKWNHHVMSFGMGDYLNYDLPQGSSGFIPNGDYYSKIYDDFFWTGSSIISNAIDQGEILVTPMQLANFTAAVANRGFYYKPHFVKKIGQTPTQFNDSKRITTIDSIHFGPIIEGMHLTITNGTARIANVEAIDICGKSGTVENFILLHGKKTQLTDHSVFIAFAPKDDPKVAIAVYVENGYWSARWAAPIASLMIEKYLTGQIQRKNLENRMLEGSLVAEYLKPLSGTGFLINQ